MEAKKQEKQEKVLEGASIKREKRQKPEPDPDKEPLIPELKKPEPEESKEEKYCKGPLIERCEKCTSLHTCINKYNKDIPNSGYLDRFVMLPYFFMDLYISKLSASATRVFLVLVNHARFTANDKEFAKCWMSYEAISKECGVKVSNMTKYMHELESHGLIEFEYWHRGRPGKYATGHKYLVCHLKRLDHLKQVDKQGKKRNK